MIECWIDNVKLDYNKETRTTQNTLGVETRVPGWGDPATVENLDRGIKFDIFGQYFQKIGDALVNVGYVRNVSLRGAPYDFRRAPNENQQWFADFKTLIENSMKINQKQPVTLVCHSMGCLMSLIFLQSQSKDWKRQFIARFITISAPWGGSVKVLKVFAVGDDFGVPLLPAKILRRAQITMPSLAWLLPSKDYWTEDETLVRTVSQSYTVNDFEGYFNGLNYSNGWEMRKDTAHFLHSNQPPDVETHCLYGTQLPTVEELSYNGDDMVKTKPKIINGNGDGTVNIRSLKGCAKWSLLQEATVNVREFPSADHYFGILRKNDVIEYILSVVA